MSYATEIPKSTIPAEPAHSRGVPDPGDEGHVPSPDELEWVVDPTLVALEAAALQRGDPDTTQPFDVCTDVGRRLLLLQLRFSSWVLRRVEKVRFVSDRRISRSSSIELRIPEDAPVLVDPGDRERKQYLVPVSVMRRRTLVNLDIRDEDDRSVSLLGLRFTQKLDASMLHAAASLVPAAGVATAELADFINDVVIGDWRLVKQRFDEYEKWRLGPPTERDQHPLNSWFDHELFAAALERTWHNFTLFVALPVEAGRHRILRLTFEESVAWRYQKPLLTPQGPRTEYKPLKKASRFLQWPWRWFGWQSTRVRFLTPSAENCASYHFEFVAPRGLWITSAELLAGRPNATRPGECTADRVRTTASSVGLHVVEVPASSLSRAQVDLSIPMRGWLSTLCVSSWAVAIVMASVTWHARLFGVSGHWGGDTQVTNIVLLLVTVCGGVTTYVAQHSAGEVAARMVTGLRILGVFSMSLPAVAAMFIVYLSTNPAPRGEALTFHLWDQLAQLRHVGGVWHGFFGTTTTQALTSRLLTLACLSVVIAMCVTLAWVRACVVQLLRGKPSPWEMTEVGDDSRDPKLDAKTKTFSTLSRELRMRAKAVGVNSAEGWHEVYTWSREKQGRALKVLAGAEPGHENPTNCRCERHVVAHGGRTPSQRDPDPSS
jgi:hypothetical protein